MRKLPVAKRVNIRLDGAEENLSGVFQSFELNNGIILDTSPPKVPQINRVAERLMKELGVRARVSLFEAKLGDTIWAESISHSNWLRNLLPSDRINENISIHIWNPCTRIDFKNLPIFGQPGFAFLYQPPTRQNRKVPEIAAPGDFVGLRERPKTVQNLQSGEGEEKHHRNQSSGLSSLFN